MRRPMRFYFNRRRLLPLLMACLVICCSTFLVVAAVQIKPLLSSLATSQVRNMVSSITTAAVSDAISSGEIVYADLIVFVKDDNGRIAALQNNMAEFTRIQSMIVQDVLERLSQVRSKDLAIPIGSLTGATLLAGRGPSIHVRMQSVGSSRAFFENKFTEAGINQTKHQILLTVEVQVSILLPGFTTSTKVSNSYEIAETIIVGEVPDTYTYFNSGDIQQTAEDYVMNHS